MQTAKLGRKWRHRTIRLNAHERQHPLEVMDEFFACFDLNDVRNTLWDWLVEVLSNDGSLSEPGRVRSNQIFFYEKMETLVEAAFLCKRKFQKSRSGQINQEGGLNEPATSC
jgi:hypothetical protein